MTELSSRLVNGSPLAVGVSRHRQELSLSSLHVSVSKSVRKEFPPWVSLSHDLRLLSCDFMGLSTWLSVNAFSLIKAKVRYVSFV